MLASLAVIAAGLGNKRFRGDADIQAATGATVLARLAGRGGPARWRRLASGEAELSEADQAALRSVNARLRGGGRIGAGRVVGFTAAQHGPASAAIAAAFARTASRDGPPALLIETNTRGKSASPQFALDSAGDWRDAVEPGADGHLDVLSGAVQIDNDMSASRVALENLLVEAREEYGLIVFAGPEAAETGALAMARMTDATVLVIDEAQADPAATRQAASRLAGMSRARLCAIAVGAA